jgi:hypothetical protein
MPTLLRCARGRGARRGLALSVLALLLTAPVRGETGPEAAAPRQEDASRYFPLAPGTRWVYRERVGLFRRRRVEVTALGLRPVRGLDTPLFVFEERGDKPFLGIEDAGLLGFRIEEGFVVRFSALGEDSRGELRLFGEEGVRILPVAPRGGEHWEQLAHLFYTPGGAGAARQWESDLTLLRSLRVPAGRYRDVAKVVADYRDPELSQTSPEITYEDYYAPGVGLVRSVARNREGGFWKRVDRELVEFHPAPAPAPAPDP